MTTPFAPFEIDYDGNIHYEKDQQQMYNTCWQELVNDSRNTTAVSCNCETKYRKMNKSQKDKTFICKCTPTKATKSAKRNKT
jgi:hypothetical protein